MRFNVIGHITSEIGLGVMACDLIRALSAAGHDVVGFDVDPDLDRQNRALEMAPFLRPANRMYSDGVDVLVFPINAVGHWSRAYPFGTRKVAVPLWELTQVNPYWLRDLEEFDGVVACSTFIGDTLRRYDVDVWDAAWPHYGSTGKNDRSAFGLPEDAVIFTFSFDPSSDVQRKNPQAIVEAFKRAALPNARLVIQINRSAEQTPALDAWLDCVDHVIVIDRHLSHADTLNLIASSDVYVSLHRAEGLGLGMLEAMQLGKPVIATGWSGNLSFMDSESACLVEYDLVPLDGRIPAYRSETIGTQTEWAEPSIEHAAWWMRFLATNAEERAAIGEWARLKADAHQAAARRLDWIDQIPARHTPKTRARHLFTPSHTARVFYDGGLIKIAAGVPIALTAAEEHELTRLGLLC